MKPGEEDQGGAGWNVSKPETKSSANTGCGADAEGVVRVRTRAEADFGEDPVTEEGVFGVQTQPSEAKLSKLEYRNKQAGEAVPVTSAVWRVAESEGKAKATRGDNAVRSSSSPSADAPALFRTSSLASGTFPSAYDHRDPSACPG